MSKLKRTQSVQREVIYAYRCDRCGKEGKGDPTHSGGVDQPDGWHSFTSYHSDWSNDSIDSHESHDACSWECYLAIVRTVFEDYGEPPERGGYRGPVRPDPTLEIDGRDWYFIRDLLAHQPQPSET